MGSKVVVLVSLQITTDFLFAMMNFLYRKIAFIQLLPGPIHITIFSNIIYIGLAQVPAC